MADKIQVFYDGQCEVCRTSVSWLRRFDRRNQMKYVPMDPASMARAGLAPEACAREIQVVTPRGALAGWNAVAYLLRLSPATWVIGAIGAVPPFRWLGNAIYRWIARHRHELSRSRESPFR